MDYEKIGREFVDFVKTIEALRDPKTGCPWDLQQTHLTLRRFMLEEAYEAVEAMGDGDSEQIADELGDVLLQVVLNAQLGKDAGTFDVLKVVQTIREKMIRRHPHVFGTEEEKKQRDIGSIKSNWQKIKADEKAAAPASEQKKAGYFETAKVHKKHPATLQAEEIGKLSKKIRFDWDTPNQVFAKLQSEIEELAECLDESKGLSRRDLEKELADVFFTWVQLCRHLGFCPEVTAQLGNTKFLNRFAKVEEALRNEGLSIQKASQQQLEKLWNQVRLADKA